MAHGGWSGFGSNPPSSAREPESSRWRSLSTSWTWKQTVRLKPGSWPLETACGSSYLVLLFFFCVCLVEWIDLYYFVQFKWYTIGAHAVKGFTFGWIWPNLRTIMRGPAGGFGLFRLSLNEISVIEGWSRFPQGCFIVVLSNWESKDSEGPHMKFETTKSDTATFVFSSQMSKWLSEIRLLAIWNTFYIEQIWRLLGIDGFEIIAKNSFRFK